jgi:hypothetical protein
MSNPYIGYVCNFNGVSFMSIPFVQVYSIDDYGQENTQNIFALARSHARKLSSSFYQGRTIFVSVYINAPSRALADQSLDKLLAIMSGNEGTLVIEKSGYVRQYTATYSKPTKNNTGVGKGTAIPPQGGYADYTFDFECSDSYGYDTNYTVMMPKSSFSSAIRQDSYTQGGSADTQVPFFEVQYTAVTGGTNATVTIGNANTGQQISVTRNTRAKTVQVNGVDVAFTGGWPEFGLGLGAFTYSDTMTTRTYNYFVYVYNRWK